MVRSNHQMNIALSPLNMSPNNYIKKQKEREERMSRKRDNQIKVIESNASRLSR